tara:strand:+ start:394 stop:582 length:189 start_codon:yes stop_codon:yes gene_type:complete
MPIPSWFDDTFLLSLVGILGGGCVYLMTFCLKSRCRVINCFCVKCERDVIPAAELNNVNNVV